MDRLRVCHIIHNTQVGGAETMLSELLRQLVDSDVESSVISLMQCGPTGEKIRHLGVPVLALECAQNGIPRPHRLLGLVRHLRKRRPDVVQTWAYHADLCGGIAARLACQAPVVWNIRHGTLDSAVDSRSTLRSAGLCARFSRFVPAKILINAHAAVAVHQEAGYDPAKMLVIPNGFDTNRFQPLELERHQLRSELGLADDIPLVGMCGRFHSHKGQHDFIKAAHSILKRYPKTRFLIAGSQCDLSNPQLLAWLAAHRVREQFILLGCREDMPRVLNSLDVYLLPSITEGMPNIVGEAMACGLPCVVTDVGDAQRLVGDCGWTVPPRDPAAMAEAVCQLLARSSEERRSIGAHGRARILEHFSISRIAQRYESVWREVATTAAGAVSPSRTPLRLTGHRAKPKLVHVTTIPMTPWLFLRGQNNYMQQQGFEVHVVSSPGAFMEKLRERDPVLAHEVPISRRIEPISDLLSVVRLWRLFRRLRPEIVQLSTPKAALLGAVAAWAARVPVRIYQIRGLSSESEVGWKRRCFQAFEHLTARLCNGCLVNAHSLLEYARRAKIVAATDGYVAGSGTSNGVDLARFDPDATVAANLSSWDPDRASEERCGPVIGYIGRLTRDKGIEELFNAWNNLRGDFPTARLLLVGPWEAENAISAECRHGLQTDPRVLLVGTQDDVESFYKAMDLFVFPSHGTEGFPNAPMEAAAMGLPVIATRVIGCVDAVVDGVTGQVISPRATGEVEMAMRAYLSNAALRRQHGQAGQARTRTGFVPEQLWEQFMAYYHSLLRRQGLPLPIATEEKQQLSHAA